MYDYRKTRLALDIECYPNYFLIAARDIDDGSKRIRFEMRGEHEELDRDKLRRFLRGSTIVTFNGNHYDLPLVVYALTNATCSELKAASDAIIVGGMKSWNFYRAYNLSIPGYIDHIDLKELPAGRHGLKNYAARLGAPTLQDLPYDPYTFLTDEEMDVVANYCDHDLDDTVLLFKNLEVRIDVRVALSNQYRMDVRSKSDAQIAETIIVALVEKKRKIKVQKPKAEDYRKGFTYSPPDSISFKSETMRDILEVVRTTRFYIDDKSGNIELPKSLTGVAIKIGKGSYKMGIGGLHSQEKNITRYADETMKLIDIDVTSFYPSLMIAMDMYPKQLGSFFLELFASFKYDRVFLKHGQLDKINPIWFALIDNDDLKGSLALIVSVLKIFLNGTYGKLGSIFSKIFAPEFLIRVTMTGQLMLLMLIEELEARGLEVASANTDGIVLHIRRDQEKLLDGIVAAWEVNTLMEMEKTEYSSIHSRDVNSYIAVTTDGKFKRKGNFSERNLSVTGNNQVCIEACIEYIKNGTPLMNTIKASDDILQFTNFQQVAGGAEKDGVFLGKVVRWYYSTEVKGAIVRVTNKHTVPMTDGARPCMTLPKQFPSDVDYTWYEREAVHMLKEMGIVYKNANKKATGTTFEAVQPGQVTVHYVDDGSLIALCGATLKDRHGVWYEPPKVKSPRICKKCREA